MRIRLPAIILSLATMLAWCSWSLAATEAGAPGVYQVADTPSATSENPFVDEGTSEEPVGIINRLCNSDCDCCCGPRWTFTAEGIALQRSTTRCRPLLLDPNTRADLLDTQTTNFAVASGMQLSAIYHNLLGHDLEVSYFQLDGFDASANVPGTSLLLPDLSGALLAVNNGQVHYTSALYNGEVNVRTQYTEWLTLLAGFRMVQLKEHMGALGSDVNNNGVPVWLQIDTCNHLYGFQLGAEAIIYDRGGPLQISSYCKAGVFGNPAEQNFHVVDPVTATDEQLSAVRRQGSFLGDTGGALTYAVTKRLAFRASAQAMWLTGVALAPEQIGTTNLRTARAVVNTSGMVFYYGGGLGLEYRF